MQAAKPAMPAQSLTPRQTAKQQQNHLSLARPRLRKAGLPASFSSASAAEHHKNKMHLGQVNKCTAGEKLDKNRFQLLAKFYVFKY